MYQTECKSKTSYKVQKIQKYTLRIHTPYKQINQYFFHIELFFLPLPFFFHLAFLFIFFFLKHTHVTLFHHCHLNLDFIKHQRHS